LWFSSLAVFFNAPCKPEAQIGAVRNYSGLCHVIGHHLQAAKTPDGTSESVFPGYW